MAINFPDPATENPFVDHNGKEWAHNGIGWWATSGTAFKFTKVAADADFAPVPADGINPLYAVSVALTATLDTGLFAVGDVVTFSIGNAASAAFVAGAGVTLTVPEGKAAASFGVGSIVSAVWRSAANVVLYGDLADA